MVGKGSEYVYEAPPAAEGKGAAGAAAASAEAGAPLLAPVATGVAAPAVAAEADPTVPPAIVEAGSFVGWLERFLGLGYVQESELQFASTDGARRVTCVEDGKDSYAQFQLLDRTSHAIVETHEVAISEGA